MMTASNKDDNRDLELFTKSLSDVYISEVSDTQGSQE